MKRLIALAAVCFLMLSVFSAAEAAIIYSEDFDTTNGGYTHSGSQDEWEWGTATVGSSTHTGWGTDLDNNYNNFADQRLVSPAIDLSLLNPSQPVTLSFDYWSQTEFIFDYSYFDYSIDGGSSWVNYELLTGGPFGWSAYTEDITGLAGSAVNLSWRLTSDFSITAPGLYIDNVQIEGTPSGGGVIPEPASLLLLGSGLLGLAGLRKRKHTT